VSECGTARRRWIQWPPRWAQPAGAMLAHLARRPPSGARRSACSSPAGLGSSPDGLRAAEQWFAAYHEALRQGAFNLGPFYTNDASIDLTTLEGPQVTGRESVLQAIGGAFVPFRNQTPESAPRQ
jgi:hypothetical protein